MDTATFLASTVWVHFFYRIMRKKSLKWVKEKYGGRMNAMHLFVKQMDEHVAKRCTASMVREFSCAPLSVNAERWFGEDGRLLNGVKVAECARDIASRGRGGVIFQSLATRVLGPAGYSDAELFLEAYRVRYYVARVEMPRMAEALPECGVERRLHLRKMAVSGETQEEREAGLFMFVELY